MTRGVRISITVSEDDLEKWKAVNKRDTLSAFIREAVNEYVKIQEPARQVSVFDVFLEQKDQFRQIQDKLTSLAKIEGDLIDLTAAMARLDFVVPVKKEDGYVWESKSEKKGK